MNAAFAVRVAVLGGTEVGGMSDEKKERGIHGWT